MKVMIVANSSKGLYRFRKELIQEIVKKHEVFVLTPDYGRVELIQQLGCQVQVISIDRRGINPAKDFLLTREIFQASRKIRPDMVLLYTIKPDIYGGIVAQLLRIPYVANITGLGTAFQRDNVIKKIVEKLYKIAFRNVKIVLFENEENRKVFIQEKIVSENKTYVLNGAGVNLIDFTFADYPEEKATIEFLFMGRIMKEKGVDELLAASRHLYEEGYQILLHILGTYEEDYKKVIEDAEKQGWLKYWGYQENVKSYICRSNCFVLPSWHEGMANTNLESAAMGRPVITSDIPGCREAVAHGESGYLCQAKNVEDLYQVMKKFIELPYEEKRNMGINARAHMEKYFDKKVIVKKTMDKIFG